MFFFVSRKKVIVWRDLANIFLLGRSWDNFFGVILRKYGERKPGICTWQVQQVQNAMMWQCEQSWLSTLQRHPLFSPDGTGKTVIVLVNFFAKVRTGLAHQVHPGSIRAVPSYTISLVPWCTSFIYLRKWVSREFFFPKDLAKGVS